MNLKRRLAHRKLFRAAEKELAEARKRPVRIEDCPACGAKKSVSPNLKSYRITQTLWFQSCRACRHDFFASK